MGAGKWNLGDYVPSLQGAAEVIIVADKDKPGRKHAAEIAASLRGKVGNLLLVEAAHGKDVSDHLDAGLTPEELERGVRLSARWRQHH